MSRALIPVPRSLMQRGQSLRPAGSSTPSPTRCTRCSRRAYSASSSKAAPSTSSSAPLSSRPLPSPPPPRRARFATRKLILPVLLVSAVSSLAINLRNAKDSYAQLESQHAAQMSVLHDLMTRLDKGEMVSKAEVRREFERVAIVEREVAAGDELQHRQKTGWREMIFGRKRTEAEMKKDADELHQAEETIRRADSGILEGGQPATSVKAVSADSTPRPSALLQITGSATPNPPEDVRESKPRKQDTGFVIV